MQFGVNHLGHFALTARLLPLLLATPGSRVATMSSMGHRAARGSGDPRLERRYDRWQAYFHSKLANLLFTAELQRRLAAADASTIAVAAHPGASNTDLGTEGSGLLQPGSPPAAGHRPVRRARRPPDAARAHRPRPSGAASTTAPVSSRSGPRRCARRPRARPATPRRPGGCGTCRWSSPVWSPRSSPDPPRSVEIHGRQARADGGRASRTSATCSPRSSSAASGGGQVADTQPAPSATNSSTPRARRYQTNAYTVCFATHRSSQAITANPTTNAITVATIIWRG